MQVSFWRGALSYRTCAFCIYVENCPEGGRLLNGLIVSVFSLSCSVCYDVQAEPAHKEAVRGIAFSPSDLKFATCSDDSTIKAGIFFTCAALHERTHRPFVLMLQGRCRT